MSGLHRRIYLHFLGVLAVVGIATSVVFALGARDAFLREVAVRTSRHVAGLVGEALGDRGMLERRLEQLHRDLEIDVTVRDLDGRVLVSAGPLLPSLSPADTARLRDGRMVARPWPRRYAAVVVRDPVSGAPRAFLEASPPRRMPAGGFLTPLVAVALVLLVVGVATRPLAHRISRPIERLTEAARRFGDGDLAFRVPVVPGVGRHRFGRARARRPDEIGELTTAFNEMAERVERIVRGEKELLANVSHELRSPLARIRVALELLPRDATSAGRIAVLEADLDELDRLIEDVLTAARLEATGLPIELGVVDARVMLDDLARRAREDPVLGGMPVHVRAEALALVADGGLLRRALWNLLENAAKYGAPPITLGATREGDAVVLSVTDEGEGIAAADRERVFAPFYRGDRARTPGDAGQRPRGVGLGLTLVRRIVDVHSGTIAIEPAAVVDGRERGCRVVLRIPSERP